MLSKHPLVSVVIPAYNHEKYIQETIKSIIAQTYKNIELIIVNDGSSDNTLIKINELKQLCEERFIRFICESQKKLGVPDTLNRLISLAAGEFIYITASDDIVKSTAIEKMVSFLKTHKKYALVVGDNEFIDKDGKCCYWDINRNLHYKQTSETYKTFADYLQKASALDFQSNLFGTYYTLIRGNYIPNGYLIRKNIFEKIKPFTKEAPLEDWYLMLQISKYAKLKFINEVLFSYRWHPDNTAKHLDVMLKNNQITLDYELNSLKSINKRYFQF